MHPCITRSRIRKQHILLLGWLAFLVFGESTRAQLVTPLEHAFGEARVGSSTPVLVSRVTNDSQGSNTVLGVQEACAPFTLAIYSVYSINNVDQTREPATLPANVATACDPEFIPPLCERVRLEIEMTFFPNMRGPASCTVVVDGDTSDSSIALTGTGVAPVLQIGPSSLAFGNRRIGTSSPTQPFTVSNNGDAGQSLAISSVAVTPNAADWVVVLDNATPIAPGQSRNGTVAFQPATAGSRNATLTVTSNDPVTPVRSIGLSGAGVTATVAAAPTELAFANVTIGTEASRILTVSNSATVDGASLQVFGVSLGGQHPGDFEMVGAVLPAAIGPGSSLQLEITCSPSALGLRSGTITVDTDADNSPQDPQIALSCTGVSPVDPLFANGFETPASRP